MDRHDLRDRDGGFFRRRPTGKTFRGNPGLDTDRSVMPVSCAFIFTLETLRQIVGA